MDTLTENENVKEFILAYVALCKKHKLCIANKAAAPLVVIKHTTVWVKDIALSEGVETFEAPCKVLKQ